MLRHRGGQSQWVLLSLCLCNILSTSAKGRQCVSHPAGSVGPSGTFSRPHPLQSFPPPTTLAHVEDMADGCPGVRRAFFFSFSLFFNKQCLPETCSSHNLLLGARQMVLAYWLPSCSLCSRRRGGKWHQGNVTSDGLVHAISPASASAKDRIHTYIHLPFKAGSRGTKRHFYQVVTWTSSAPCIQRRGRQC